MTREFLNKNYFVFSFALISKKISIYISIAIYLLLILSYTLVVPLMAKKQPIELFLFPIAPSFLLFAMVVVSCFIAIEIFRTPIDDGTELLVVSKPLSRRQICMVKFVIFFIYIIAISILASIFATLSFAVPQSEPEDNKNIVIGILFASFIIGSLFGSLAIFFSLFSKKIMSMLTTIGLAFLLNVSSMLSTVVFETPVTIIQNSENVIATSSILNLKNKHNQIINGIISGDTTGKKTAKQIYEEAYDKSPFTKTIYTDFSMQLSSLYTFGRASSDTSLAIKTQFSINSPYKLEFYDYSVPTVDSTNPNNLNNPENTSYLRITIPEQWIKSFVPNATNEIVNAAIDQIYLFSTNSKSRISPTDSKKTNVSGSKKYTTNEIEQIDSLNDVTFYKMLYVELNEAFKKYKEDIDKNPPIDLTTSPPTSTKDVIKIIKFLATSLNNVVGNMVENYFTPHLKYNMSNRRDEEYIESKIAYYNRFIYTGITKFLNNATISFQNIYDKINTIINGSSNGNITEILNKLFDAVYSDEELQKILFQMVFLRFASLDFESLIESLEKLTITNDVFQTYIPFEATLSDGSQPLNFYFNSVVKLQSQIPLKTFEGANVVSVYNTAALIVTWLIVSWILLGITMSLYYRRDFA